MTVLHRPAQQHSAEFETLSDGDFATIKSIALERAGLQLPDAKRLMVQSRMAKRVRAAGFASFSTYINYVRNGQDADENHALISALTTNVTSFFREKHHFETLARLVLPGLINTARTGARVRLWSAGCSSGEEAYSLAMLISHLARDAHELDIKILATDIDSQILSKAREGVYPADSLNSLPFNISPMDGFEDAGHGMVAASDYLRRMLSIRTLNLHAPWPMPNAFDVILCRNVVIYFDADHQAALWPRFRNSLKPSGWLFLGHSERIHPIEGSGFRTKGLTTYIRCDHDRRLNFKGKN